MRILKMAGNKNIQKCKGTFEKLLLDVLKTSLELTLDNTKDIV